MPDKTAKTAETASDRLQKARAPGQQVESATVASDGTITIAHDQAKLQFVDVADVDLLLSFSDSTFVVIPNGALDALSDTTYSIFFNDSKDTLNNLFKNVGIMNPAKAGSLRLVSENIDAEPLPTEDLSTTTYEEYPEIATTPAPMLKVSSGTALPGKGPGFGGSGTGEGESADIITPLATPQPTVYRVGQKPQVSVEEILTGAGLGMPNVTADLYTSSQFKVAPSGRLDSPLGAYDSSATPEQLATRSSPAGQSFREAIQGTAAADTIDFNPAFSSGVGQWSKDLHITLNNFSDVTSIALVFDAAKIAGIPGFDLQGSGVTRDTPTSNSWHVAPDQAMLLNGLDISIVYNVNNGVVPIDFLADLVVDGHAGLFALQVTENLNFTWRDAQTQEDFTVTSSTGVPLMVLPSGGVGVEVFAGNGDDIINSGAGSDILHGGAGDDTLNGLRGDDVLDGGPGADILNGGLGIDTATYENAGAAVNASLTAGTGTMGEANGDTYISIENLTGSSYDDTLRGNDVDNILSGGAGNDLLISGRVGNDTINGGAGTDTASYEFETSAVTANLTTNTGIKANGNDVLLYIENLIGGSGNDTFTGPAGIQANAFDGRGGVSDTVSYASSAEGIVATLDPALLLAPVAQTNDALGDTFVNIENLTGTMYDDTLIGNNVANILAGGSGNDVLEGLGGADTFIGGAGTDTVSYANSTLGVVSSMTTVFGSGPAVVQTNDALGDTYSSIENMIGSRSDDTLIGDNQDNRIEGSLGNDTLEGMGGADALIGGFGTDTASYAHASTYVVASLTPGLAGVISAGDALGDTYDSIENLIGSNGNDTLIGNSAANTIFGGLGDDIMEGIGGGDTYDGGTGNNTVSYAHAPVIGLDTGVTASLLTPAGNQGAAAGDIYSLLIDGITPSVQNLTGSDFNDTLEGDANNNILIGGAGNDTLTGGAGTDTLYGGVGDDTLIDDGVGEAKLYGEAGDDIFRITGADAIRDVIDGGNKSDLRLSGAWSGAGDTISWEATTFNRIDVDMMNGLIYTRAPVVGNSLGFSNIENFTVTGNNTIYATLDNYSNTIDATSNGTAIDYVLYQNALGSISLNLTWDGTNPNVTGGSSVLDNLVGTTWTGTGDTLKGIEYVYNGSNYADNIYGSDGVNNWLAGGLGADYINGGTGSDTVYLNPGRSQALVASLLSINQNAAMGIVMTDAAQGDVYVDMENLYSSGVSDQLYGNAGVNVLSSNGTMEGFMGADRLVGLGGTGATASYANAGNVYLAGQGITTAASLGVTADLTNPGGAAFVNFFPGMSDTSGLGAKVANTGDALGDTYSNIYDLTGSAFNDILVGNTLNNTITGGDGDDLMEGMAGADYFKGGNGIDTVSYAHAAAGVIMDLGTSGLYIKAGDILTAVNDAVTVATVAGDLVVTALDTYLDVENIIGSAFDDTLAGNSLANVIEGGPGDDFLDGGAHSDGFDIASYAHAPGAVTVSLAVAGAQNTVNAGTDTLVNIEGLLGSGYADTLTGDGNSNWIDGGDGADNLDGGGGIDTLAYASATAGVTVTLNGANSQSDILSNFENLTGSLYNDILTGDIQSNVIEGDLGDDTLDGGANTTGIGDTASYSRATAGVTVSLLAGTASGGAGNDTLVNFENLIGSAYNDTLAGDGFANTLDGGAGDDVLIGGVGADVLIGGQGTDTASYASALAAVSVTINGVGTVGDALGDVLTGIENLIGSAHDDTLIGDGGANVFDGGLGSNIINGGAGIDTVSYATASGPMTVNILNAGTNATGGGRSDQLSQIENLIGSAYADSLTGDGGNNIIEGGAGADTLDGGSGIDTASYLSSDAAVYVSLVSGAINTGGHAAGDVLSNFENLTGSAYNDTLTGDGLANTLDGGAGDDVLIGGVGGDTLIGGTGNNTASYINATGAVTANLTTGTGTGGEAAGDTFSGIQNLTGGTGNDTLTGDSYANILIGGGGNDTMRGGAGNDIIYANQGHDTAYGENNNDTFYVSSLNDNLPTLINGGGRDAGYVQNHGGNVMVLQDLVNGNYSMNSLVDTNSRLVNIDTLNIRDGVSTKIMISSLDIRYMVDNGNASQLFVEADNGDTINISLAAGETMGVSHITSAANASVYTDYTVFNAEYLQVAQVHWHAAA